MKSKVYFPNELIATVLDFEKELKTGKDVSFPVNVNDLVVWSDDDGIDRKTFKISMDLHFEYELIGSDSSLYLITGLKKHLNLRESSG